MERKIRIFHHRKADRAGGVAYNVLNEIKTGISVGGFSFNSEHTNPKDASKFTDAEIRLAIAEYEVNLERATREVRERQAELRALLEVYTIQQISNTYALLDENHTVLTNADTRRQLLEKVSPYVQIREGNGQIYTASELLAGGPQPK